MMLGNNNAAFSISAKGPEEYCALVNKELFMQKESDTCDKSLTVSTIDGKSIRVSLNEEEKPIIDIDNLINPENLKITVKDLSNKTIFDSTSKAPVAKMDHWMKKVK